MITGQTGHNLETHKILKRTDALNALRKKVKTTGASGDRNKHAGMCGIYNKMRWRMDERVHVEVGDKRTVAAAELLATATNTICGN